VKLYINMLIQFNKTNNKNYKITKKAVEKGDEWMNRMKNTI
jgi:hypothetical protein